ncbi:MAG: hypothetical protein EOP61_24070 [Sphingomonadales bacterium]|nr:MAG: hypothetical protein EOP61_24070 [Sphingomonadales bacterium]
MDQESEYYLRRAETELAMAQSASHPSAVRVHYHLAGRYLDKAYGEHIEKAPPPEGRMLLNDEGAEAA